jgi:hypothetical protein
MSRSFKKHPICGNSKAESEKEDKVRAHKKFRKLTKNKLKEVSKLIEQRLDEEKEWGTDIFPMLPEEILPEKIEEVSDEWTFAKDGKQIVKGKEKEKILRK